MSDEQVDGQEQKEVKEKINSIFITEDNTFDVFITYYHKDEKLFVEGEDEDFDSSEKAKEFTMTFKHPDQGDLSKISLTSNPGISNVEVSDILRLELARVLVLMRKWTLEKELSNENIMNLDPKIVRSIINKMMEKIGTEGMI